jgi:hypothetical protein
MDGLSCLFEELNGTVAEFRVGNSLVPRCTAQIQDND